MIKKIIDWFFGPIKKKLTKIKNAIIFNYVVLFIVIVILIIIIKLGG